MQNNASVTTIRVVMDNNYPPYSFVDDQGRLQGILVDQWALWEKRTGVHVELTGLAWDEALRRMKNGEFDVIDTIFYTEERAKIYDFTEPYAQINVRIFFPKDVSGFATAENLKGFRVAVKAGDANAEYLFERGITDLHFYNSYEEIIQAVSRQQETIFVIDEPPALYFLYKYNIQDQFNYSEPLYGGAFHRAVRKGDVQLLHLINTGFKMISPVEYREIDNRWFGTQQYRELNEILSYLSIAATAAGLVILVLSIFNRTLQTRVRLRTSELERALDDLRLSETRFRDSIEFLPIPMSIADTNGKILTVNRKFVEHYGYTTEDIPTIPEWSIKAYPDEAYRSRVLAMWDDDVTGALQGRTITKPREYKVTAKDGSLHDVEIIMRPVGDIWVASFLDITERKRAEEAIRKSESRYRTLFEDSPIPLLEEDFSSVRSVLGDLSQDATIELLSKIRGNPGAAKNYMKNVHIVDANRAAVKWFGASDKNEMLAPLSQLINPDEQGSFVDELASLIEGKTRYEVTVSRLTKDGSPIHLIISGTVAPGYEDTWGRVLVSILDITESKRAEENLAEAYDTTLEGWAKALELRDKETEGHSRRVMQTTLNIAREMGVDEGELVHVRRGAILHDIGKMAIPDDILRKRGPLTREERSIVNLHPQVAYDLLSRIPYLKKAIEIPYCHHEKWDGTGYPRGLKGAEIPLTARIFAVVDVWDALSSDRPYRPAWPKEKVTEYIKNESGKHFDPEVVRVFMILLEQGKI